MTRSSIQLSSMGQDQTLYNNALIWNTRFSDKLNDYRSVDESETERYDLDQFRRDSDEGQREHRPLETIQGDNNTVIRDTDELSKLWTCFASQTSFHGVKNIVNKDRRTYSRLLWLTIVVAMAVGMMYTVAELLIDYYRYTTVTKSDVKIQQQTIFPSVTMCNTCPYQNIDGRIDSSLFNLLAARAFIPKNTFPLNESDHETQSLMKMDLTDLQRMIAFQATDMFLNVQYENVVLNVSQAFEVTETTYGRCYTFNGPQYITDNGPRVATFDGQESGLRLYARLHQDKYFVYGDLTAGLRIFINHHRDTPRLRQDGIDIHPGTSSRVALNPVKYSFLPAPYKSYGEGTCEETDVKDFLHKMVNASFYSYYNCLEQCHNYRASIACSCHTLLLYVPGVPQCTIGDFLSCFIPAKENMRPDECDCPRPCSITLYEPILSSSQFPSSVSAEALRQFFNVSTVEDFREDYLEVRIYFNTMMLRHDWHEGQYTFSSVFAFLGGQMGFFIGASLISLAELLETIILSGCQFARTKVMRMGRVKATSPIATRSTLTSKTQLRAHNKISMR